MFQEFITNKFFFLIYQCAENISYKKLNPQQMPRRWLKQHSNTSCGCSKDINFYLRVITKTFTKGRCFDDQVIKSIELFIYFFL